jgi:hypothetical protein
MIGRTLSRRVQKLEARLAPSGEPIIIQIKYVSPDGMVRDGPRIGCGGLFADADQRTRATPESYRY